MNLADFASRYPALRGDLAPRTLDAHRETLRRLCAYAPRTPLDALTTAKIAAWEASMHLTHALSTRRRHVRALYSIMETAKLHGLIADNPARGLAMAHPTTDRERVYVPATDVDLLIAHLGVTHAASSMLALCRFAGLRCHEALHVEPGHVDLALRRLTVQHVGPQTTKRRRRVVPICDELRRVLTARIAERVSALRLTPAIVGAVSAHTLRLEIVEARAATGVAPWPRMFQDLRLSCEHDWVHTPGVSLTDAAQMIGHSVTVMMRHYNVVTDRAMDAIAGATP